MRTLARSTSRAKHSRRRAGFSVLELVLASMLGVMVLVGVLSIMFSLERTGTSLQRRGDEAAGLQRTRLVMQRAFGSILTAQVQFVRTPGATAGQSDEETAPPRVLLEPDMAVNALMRRPDPDGAQTLSPVQRLELVLIDPPVPANARDPFDVASAVVERSGRRSTQEDDEAEVQPVALATPPNVDDAVRAVRGAFELRPQERRASDPSDAPQCYELWWMPVHLDDEGNLEDEDPGLTDAVAHATREKPYLIADNLTFVRWRMFDDRVKKTEFRAVAANKLPAYIEMEVRTRGGLEGQWLFEIGWAVGPEKPQQVASISGGAVGATAGTAGTGGESSSTQQINGTTRVETSTTIFTPGSASRVSPGEPIAIPSPTPRMLPRAPGRTPPTIQERLRRRRLEGGSTDGQGQRPRGGS